MKAEVMIAVSLLLISAFWTDLRRMRIPNELTVTFAIGGILYHLLASGWHTLGWPLLGGAAGFIPLYVMNRMGGIGGGDVKLFAAVGLWLGPWLTLKLLVFSLLIAGGIAVVMLVLRLPGIRRLNQHILLPWGIQSLSEWRSTPLPFMLAVAPGFITLLVKG